jgi:predicted metalloprotease with PDZ domain
VIRAAALAPLLVLACSHPAVTRSAAPAPSSPVAPAADWIYDVSAGSGAKELSVAASFPAGSEAELSVDDGAEPFVRDVAVQRGNSWQPVSPSGTSWLVPDCSSTGCRIRYRFLLADASTKLDDPDVAMSQGEVFEAPPSTWLLRPLTDRAARSFRFHVSTPKDVTFATGVFPSTSETDTFRASIGDLPAAPYSAFGNLRTVQIDVSGRSVDVAIAPGEFAVGETAVLDWIRASADVVAKYYGYFPVERVLLLVLPGRGKGLGYGKTLGNGGASILLPIGEATTLRQLEEDWVLVHEMIHLGFPSVPRQHIWLEEGIATYVEPFARARAGRLSAEEVWRGLVRGLPNGLPGQGDRGLDNTHNWGRTYWGGALYCLLADLEIREHTGGKRSLDDALRAILAAGGDVAVRWDLARALDAGDVAVGAPVLSDLHRRMGTRPYDVDLASLWQKLGVKVVRDRVIFDDGAPLASVRQSMTARR